MKIKHPSFSLKYSMVTLLSLIILSTIAVKSAEINTKVDLNNDNKIDIVDLSIMLSNFGKLTGLGDANSDNKINSDDVKILVENYGTTPTSTSGEPPRVCQGSSTDRGLVRQMDYATATSLIGPNMWKVLQLPSAPGINGTVQKDRIRIVRGADVPGATSTTPQTYRPMAAMRVELRPFDNPSTAAQADGDVSTITGSNTGAYTGSGRSEVQGYTEPNNVTRWYGFSFYVPADYVAGDSDQWAFITQFHDSHVTTKSPPLSLGIYQDKLLFITRKTTLVKKTDPVTQKVTYEEKESEVKKMETPLTPGKWMRIEFGVKLATDESGWIQMWINGQKVPARNGEKLTDIKTQNLDNDKQPDPLYIKQGVYQKISWRTTNVFYFGPMKVGKDCMDVLP